MTQTNPAVRYIAVNGNGGAMTIIRCSIIAGYMEVDEAPAAAGGAGQGLQGNRLDTFTAKPEAGAALETWLPSSAQYPAGDFPIEIGDPRHDHGAQFMPIGNPGSGTYIDTRSQNPQTLPAGPGYQNPSLGTPILQLQGASVAATVVRVKEWA